MPDPTTPAAPASTPAPRPDGDTPDRKPPETLERLAGAEGPRGASGAGVNGQEADEALRWLLEDAPDEGDLPSKEITVNVGSADKPRKVTLTIRGVDEQKMRQIRERVQNRAERRRRGPGSGTVDENEVNVRVIAEAIVKPDLDDVCRQLQINDKSMWVRKKLAHKPGLITQIAGEVYQLSGYDEDDIEEPGEREGASS
jgi:Phage XkdN-like tail assembly chaperone protein, TAC